MKTCGHKIKIFIHSNLNYEALRGMTRWQRRATARWLRNAARTANDPQLVGLRSGSNGSVDVGVGVPQLGDRIVYWDGKTTRFEDL